MIKKNVQTVPTNVCVGYSFHLFLESLLLVEAFWASDYIYFPNTVPPLIWAPWPVDPNPRTADWCKVANAILSRRGAKGKLCWCWLNQI